MTDKEVETSIYESAHKGDFEMIRKKLDENPTLLTVPDSNKRILIHWASLSGNVKLVTYLIELNSPIDPEDESNTTPLILASSAGHGQIVKLLLENGANVNQKSIYGHSALQYAASKNWLQVCLLLLENGADINIADDRNSTPLHRAASKGNIDIVKLFMSYIQNLHINAKDNTGSTPLHLACEEDRQDEALLLIDNGADVEALNKGKQTPLDVCSLKLAKLIRNKIAKK